MMRSSIARLAVLPKFTGLLLMIVTVFAVLSITENESKVITSIIGGVASGFALAIRVFFMGGNADTILGEASKSVREAHSNFQNHPIRKSLIDIDRKLKGNLTYLPEVNSHTSSEAISTLKNTKVIASAFLLTILFIYGYFLQPDTQSILSTVKNILFQVMSILCISIGFLGLFLNLLGVSKFQGEIK